MHIEYRKTRAIYPQFITYGSVPAISRYLSTKTFVMHHNKNANIEQIKFVAKISNQLQLCVFDFPLKGIKSSCFEESYF